MAASAFLLPSTSRHATRFAWMLILSAFVATNPRMSVWGLSLSPPPTQAAASAHVHPQTTSTANALVNRRDAATAAFSLTLTIPALFVTTPLAAVASDLGSDYQSGPEGIQYKVQKKGNPEIGPPQRSQIVQTSYTLWINGFPDDNDNSGKMSKQIDSTQKPLLGDQPFKVRGKFRFNV